MLTLQFVPYTEISGLSSKERIDKVLEIAKENKIILMEGRLKKQEETELIKRTMEEINEEFKGIELSVVYQEKTDKIWFNKLKSNVISFLLGNREGFTIIGPASVVKEIRKDPNKIQLLTKDVPLKKKKRR